MENKTVWSIVNSNFFLWAMGVIAVSLVPFFYESCKHSREEERHKQRLYSEIKNRFSQMFIWLKRGVDSSGQVMNNNDPTAGTIHVHEVMYGFLYPPARTQRPQYYSTYKEFEDQSTISIIYELIGLEKDPSQKQRLEKTVVSLINVENIPTEPYIELKAVDYVVQEVKKDIYIDDWKEGYN